MCRGSWSRVRFEWANMNLRVFYYAIIARNCYYTIRECGRLAAMEDDERGTSAQGRDAEFVRHDVVKMGV